MRSNTPDIRFAHSHTVNQIPKQHKVIIAIWSDFLNCSKNINDIDHQVSLILIGQSIQRKKATQQNKQVTDCWGNILIHKNKKSCKLQLWYWKTEEEQQKCQSMHEINNLFIDLYHNLCICWPSAENWHCVYMCVYVCGGGGCWWVCQCVCVKSTDRAWVKDSPFTTWEC